MRKLWVSMMVVAAPLQAAPVEYAIGPAPFSSFDFVNANDQFIAPRFPLGAPVLYDGDTAQGIPSIAGGYPGQFLNRALFLNDSGQVAGIEYERTVSNSIAWRYDAGSVTDVGLAGSTYTHDTDGSRYSLVSGLASNGDVAGTSRRYGVGGADLGTDAWSYDGTQTTVIGLTSGVYTNPDGIRSSEVTHVTASGQVFGISRRFTASTSLSNKAAWVYDGDSTTQIGLVGSPYESLSGQLGSTIERVSESGFASGNSQRFAANGTSFRGTDAWIYDGTGSQQIGLYGAEFSRPNGFRNNQTVGLSESGKVAGSAYRYSSSGGDLGRAAWVYDGQATQRAGLVDAEHTRGTDGYQNSYLRGFTLGFVTEAGESAGQSVRYDGAGNANGLSAWFFDGAATQKIGLVDLEHSNALTGYQLNRVWDVAKSGQVVGTAERIGSDGSDLGTSAWLFDGVDSLNIGLTDAEHTSAAGSRGANLVALNDTGQVVGGSVRYVGHSVFGESNTAWFFDGTDTVELFAPVDEGYTGYSASYATHLTDDGTVFGYYLTENASAYSNGGPGLEKRLFAYTEALGVLDLLTLVNASILSIDNTPDDGDEFWISSVEHVYSDGSILVGGSGVDANDPNNLQPYSGLYKLTVVPVPATAWLFFSALGALGWLRRKPLQKARHVA